MPLPDTTPDPVFATGPARPRLRACLALGLLTFVCYNVNFRLVSSGDNYPARYLPFALLGHGTLSLDPVKHVASQGRVQPYWLIAGRNGRLVSQYPVVAPVLVTPLYLPAVAYLDIRGWTDSRVDRLARLMEKISASVIASLSAMLMYLLLLRRADARTAMLLAVAYALGTNTWMIGSQGLWQHGMGELLLTAALLLVTGKCTLQRAFGLGAVCALAVFNRPPDAILAAAIGIWSIPWAWRKFPAVAAGAAIPAALLLAYNIGVVGNPVGGYAIAMNADFFRFSIPLGVAGLLFSLGRGLFVFTPFLFAIPLFLRRALGGPGRGLSILVCIAFVIQLLFYAKVDWRGGASWGPRYLTDALPFLIWLLPPVVRVMARPARAVFVATVGASIAIQAIGAFWYIGSSDDAMRSTDGDPAAMNAVWNLRSTPFLFELRHPMAFRDLFLKVEGGIDSVTAGGAETAQAPAGTPVTVTGWTLADNRTPSNVLAVITPGAYMPWSPAVQYPVARSHKFTPRPDVSAGARPDARAGWSIVLDTAGLPPGNYDIEVMAQGGEGGEYRPVAQREFQVLPQQWKVLRVKF